MKELQWMRNQESISSLAMVDATVQLSLYKYVRSKNITDAVDITKF